MYHEKKKLKFMKVIIRETQKVRKSVNRLSTSICTAKMLAGIKTISELLVTISELLVSRTTIQV